MTGRPNCPGCTAEVGEATMRVGDLVAQPGDFFLCQHCGYLAVWAGDGQIRQPTDQELATAVTRPVIRQLRQLLRELGGMQ